MNITEYFKANAKKQTALPILSFPAAKKLNVNILELILSSTLQAKAMEIVAHQTDTIAAVSLMDLSVEAEAFGANVLFSDNEVPTVSGQLVATPTDAAALVIPPLTKGRALLCVDAVKQAKSLICDKPVFAGIIGPFSLAGRLMDVTEIMYNCIDEPEMVHHVLEKATQYLISYCEAYRAAGADGIVMAEPLAGLLSKEMVIEFSCPYVKKIIDAVQTDSFAVIYHNCGNTTPYMLDSLFALNATAYHFGNAVSMKDILAKAPSDVICMGNLDPAGVLAQGTPDIVQDATLHLLSQCACYPNFILSSGCDIPAHAPWENIEALFSALAIFKQRGKAEL